MGHKKIFFLSACVFLFLFSFFLYRQSQQNSFFTLNEIAKPLPFYSKWEIGELLNEEKNDIQEALNQTYSYLGKGAQSFAFASKDGRYVIKFFKFKHLRLNFLQSLVPEMGPLRNWKKNKLEDKLKRLEKLFDAYKLAYDVHRKESAIIYLHLNLTDNKLPSLKVYDPSGKEMLLELDQIPFIVQQKVEITRSIFDKLFKSKNLKEAKEKINLILNLYLTEYAKGIYDHDHGVMHNTGFIKGTPVHLDVGKLYLDETIKIPENAYLDIVKIGWKMREYMLRRFPEYEREITLHLNQTIGEAFRKHLDYDEIDGSILWKRRS